MLSYQFCVTKGELRGGGMVWQRERKREEVREGERERESHALARESVISQIHVYSVKLLP